MYLAYFSDMPSGSSYVPTKPVYTVDELAFVKLETAFGLDAYDNIGVLFKTLIYGDETPIFNCGETIEFFL